MLRMRSRYQIGVSLMMPLTYSSGSANRYMLKKNMMSSAQNRIGHAANHRQDSAAEPAYGVCHLRNSLADKIVRRLGIRRRQKANPL